MAPSQLSLPSCAWHPKRGQRTDTTWRSGKFSGWHKHWKGGRGAEAIVAAGCFTLWNQVTLSRRSNTLIHINPAVAVSGTTAHPQMFTVLCRGCVCKGGEDLSHPACLAQRTVLRASGAFYWNRGCMCYVMGTSSQQVDHWLARLINATTGKKSEKLESALLMSMVPPRAGVLPWEWAPNWTGGTRAGQWYQSQYQSWPMAHQQPHAGCGTRKEAGRKGTSC